MTRVSHWGSVESRHGRHSSLGPFFSSARSCASGLPPSLPLGNSSLRNPAQGFVGFLRCGHAHLDQQREPTSFVVVQSMGVWAAWSIHTIGLRWCVAIACVVIDGTYELNHVPETTLVQSVRKSKKTT